MFGMLIFCTDSFYKDMLRFDAFFYLSIKSCTDKEFLKISRFYVNWVTEGLGFYDRNQHI